MTTRLYNSFIDVLVAVGLDRDTGPHLQHDPAQRKSSIFCRCEPQVLAAISSLAASLPQAFPNFDNNYPPGPRHAHNHRMAERRSNPTHRVSEMIPEKKAHHTSFPYDKKKMSRGKSFHVVDSSILRKTFNARSVSSKPPELPVLTETINNLPHFCFPEQAFIYEKPPEDSTHSLVFTDLYANRTYAVCHTFYLPFILEKESDECYLVADDGQVLYEGQQRCYVPQCTVLISKYPYFTVMEQCNSWMVSHIKQDPDGMLEFLEKFALQLSTTPVPCSGKLSFATNVEGRDIIIHPPIDRYGKIVDIPLNQIFLRMSVDNILKVFRSFLLQQRIVVVSSNIGLLTLACETFLCLISPFTWQMSYAPVMPSSKVDYTGAPGTFLMGFHSDALDCIQEVEGLVIVNFDSGEVTMDETVIQCPLPADVVDLFKKTFEDIVLSYDVYSLGRPSICNIDDYRQRKSAFQKKCNHEISSAFLEMMVNLLGGVLDHIKPEVNVFNKKKFLDSQSPDDLPFYEELVLTEIFQSFLKERLADTRDSWFKLADRTRTTNKKNSLGPGGSPLAIRTSTLPRRPSSLVLLSQSEPEDNKIYQLPEFIFGPSDRFYAICINELSTLAIHTKCASIRGSYLYTKAMMEVAKGTPLKGLETFSALYSADARLLEREVIKDIMDQLTPMQKEELEATEFYHSWKKLRVLTEKRAEIEAVKIEFDKVPEKAVHKFTFIECVQKLDIVADQDSIERLFHSLTLGEEDKLEAETFREFYECWKDNETQCHDLRIEDGKLDFSECVLKVSGLVGTDLGNGRLVLTQKRLCFLQDGTQRYHDVALLRDIKALEKHQLTWVFRTIDVLKIVYQDPSKPSFNAWLKEERNCWYLLVKEMWCGKLIAEEVKEPGIIQQAAQNVLLIDAVIKSGEDECTTHSVNVDRAALNLCHYTKRHEDNADVLPEETKNVLVERINTNSREKEKRAVECVLYVPGDSSEQDPRLWCGMGMAGQNHGKIKVYDARACTMDYEFVEPKNMVIAMVLVGSQVWAGCMDGIIYIIDSQTVNCHQKLMDHSDQVSDVSLSDDKRTVYSSSLNGEIIQWDAETGKKTNMFQLNNSSTLTSVRCVANTLYCCLKSEIKILKNCGTEITTLQYKDENNKVQLLEDFLVCTNGEIWAGCKSQGRLVVWDRYFTRLGILYVSSESCRGIASLIQVHNKVWVGGKSSISYSSSEERDGSIYIFDTKTHQQDDNVLKAHSDTVRCMCMAELKYVITGSGSSDGRVALWRAAGPPAMHDSDGSEGEASPYSSVSEVDATDNM